MITKTAWKNVWRNKTRSLVVITAVTIGIFAGVFAVGVMNGAIDQRIDSAIDNEISHIQITAKGFRLNNEPGSYLTDVRSLKDSISAIEEVQAVCDRLFVVGMASTARKSTGVNIIGIDPAGEKEVFNLHNELEPGMGNYFGGEKGSYSVYMGKELAKELNVIRYGMNDDIIDELRSSGIPEGILSELSSFSGNRFSSEKDFKKKMRSVLTEEQEAEYGRSLIEAASDFSERARVVFTFVDMNNTQTGGVFRTRGVYDIPNSMFEKRYVFTRKAVLRSLAGFPENTAHKVIIRLHDIDDTKKVSKKLRADYPGLEVLSWRDIQPDLALTSEMAEAIYGLFMVLILAALAFGIVNTMLMVVLERTKEIGMLTAIGMNKKKVFRMIMTESVFLSLIGGVAGMAISWIVIRLTSEKGINFRSMEEGFEALGYSAHIYPDIGPDFFLIVTGLIIITGILSSVYPAIKALKLDPADALRTE